MAAHACGVWVQVDDLLGTWTAKQYIDERDALLKKIVDWADKSPRRYGSTKPSSPPKSWHRLDTCAC